MPIDCRPEVKLLRLPDLNGAPILSSDAPTRFNKNVIWRRNWSGPGDDLAELRHNRLQYHVKTEGAFIQWQMRISSFHLRPLRGVHIDFAAAIQCCRFPSHRATVLRRPPDQGWQPEKPR